MTTPPESHPPEPAPAAPVPDGPAPDGPLDETDARVLAGLRGLWQAADPMPEDLLTRIRFAIELEDVDLEVLRMTETREPAAVRGEELSRLITFDSESLTIMVRLKPNADGTIRVDGWLTPADCHPVELRADGRTLTTESDEDGRFVLTAVPPGLAQLVVRPTGTARTVTTPAISL